MKNIKHILITGASSGIGAALAVNYASKHTGEIRLSLGGRNKKRLEKTARQCFELGASVQTTIVDITNKKAVREWIEKADSETPINLVIANAGISGGTGPQGHEPEDQTRKIFDVNLNGTLNTIEPIIPLMRQRKSGQIALMSSLAGSRGWPGAPAYCASKAAVKVYGEALRISLYKSGINVNVICPCFIKTPMTDVNDFNMPFLITAEKAAKIITKGLEKNKGRIAFPFPSAFVAWLLASIPDCMFFQIAKRSPQKKPLER